MPEKFFNKKDFEILEKMQVIMMCGLPGCGKSTLAKKLSLFLKAKLISSDKIREKVFKSVRYDHRGDISVTSIRSKYYARLFQEVKKFILEGKKVIIDASNMDKQRTALINKIVVLIGKSDILIIVVKTPKKIIAERMKKIKKMANAKEDFFSGWKRVYGYFEKHLKEGSYSWPCREEKVEILEFVND